MPPNSNPDRDVPMDCARCGSLIASVSTDRYQCSACGHINAPGPRIFTKERAMPDAPGPFFSAAMVSTGWWRASLTNASTKPVPRK